LAVRTAETGASGTVHQWWSDPTGSLGTATLDTASATPTWLLGDYQGTITATATGAGLTGGGALDPFGQSTAPTTGDYTANPLRYQGQYLDSVTGLYDTRARDYDPSSGRFTTPDTQSAAPGSVFFDTYAYGYNRPTSTTDPSGRCPWCIGALVGAVAGGIYGGISCATDWHGWGNCAQKVGTDALIGGIAGGTLGYVAPEAVTFFAPDVLAESAGTSVTGTFLAQSTLVGAADYLATDWANTTFDGGTYTNAQATSDLFTGAVGGLAGPLTGAVASQLFDSAAAIAARWVARNDPGPEPAPATIACSDANAPAGGTGNGDPIPTGGAASSSGHSIWDDITATQPDYPGSALPKSFELTAGDTKVWVHGNATEHMAEYLSGMAARGASRTQVDMATQAQLSSLQAAVAEAGRGGLVYDRILNVGGWELKFGAARSEGQLPALIHALYTG
jgi:RHS repeat-associated protein